jgi:predicted nucleotidyltransferase
MVRSLTIEQRREDILRIAARHGASNVRVFGSAARGDAIEGSDLDLLVKFDADRSLLDHGALIDNLSELLGIKVDVVSEGALKGRFGEHVLAEARKL